MFFELLSIRSSSSRILACVEVRYWTAGVVDNLYIIAEECCLDKVYPLGVDFGWVGTVYIATVGGSKVEMNCFGNESLVFGRVSMTDRWCSN